MPIRPETSIHRSPMEVLFANALTDARWPVRKHESGALVRVVPNERRIVAGLSYELDFGFSVRAQDGTEWEVFLDVEIDGHDFHERTKEQARRDRSRDRALTRHDISVIRFTGAEVYADARGCVEETEEIVAAEVARRTVVAPVLDPSRDRRAYDAVRAIKTLVIDALESVQMLNNGDMGEPVDDTGTSWRDEHRAAVGLLQQASSDCARILG